MATGPTGPAAVSIRGELCAAARVLAVHRVSHAAEVDDRLFV